MIAHHPPPYSSYASALGPTIRAEVIAAGEWHSGCPVPLSGLRVLKVTYWGFDSRAHPGELIVNAAAVRPLSIVFRKLYVARFPIRHMQLSDTYGPVKGRPHDDDITASFECRQAAASPCSGKARTGTWSEHAYGEAVDINPVENPYVGCGMTRDKTALSFVKRTPLRKGMVTNLVLQSFASVGWGWGGSWSGTTKDYMHFSATGH